MWMKNKKGLFLVKLAYRVAMQVQRGEGWIENSRGYVGKQVWTALWKLRIPNKIKVFGWRACHEILSTRMNLARQRVVGDNVCLNCTRFPKTIYMLYGIVRLQRMCGQEAYQSCKNVPMSNLT